MIFIFYVHLFKDHMYHFLSLVLPYFIGSFKGVYEILFLKFVSTCSQSYRKIMIMQQIRMLKV